MAAALQCDVCEELYKDYKVEPNYRQKVGLTYKQVPWYALVDVDPQATQQWADKYRIDMCPLCLRRVVAEYLEAIPTEA